MSEEILTPLEETRKVDTSDIRPSDESWRQANKYRMKRFSGRKLTLPTGIAIEASRYANVKPPGADNTYILHSPEKILKRPKPNCRYVWRLRNDEETLGLIETQEIRPVALEEIVRDRTTSKIIGYPGPGGRSYCAWKRHGLFEISPQLAYEWYGHPEDWALAKLLPIESGEYWANKVEEETKGKMEGTFEIRDTRPVRRDAGAKPTSRQ